VRKKPDYGQYFIAFRRDMCPVEGPWGPTPIIPGWLVEWYSACFPLPDGDPIARNVIDARTKKEGKSADAAAVALYMATRAPYGEVVIAASDRDQAKDRVFRAVKFAVRNGPLKKHAKVYRATIEFDNESTIVALPMDWQGAAGGNYRAVIFDELHTYIHEGNRRMFDELIIPPTQPYGVRWIASYAGWLNESMLLKEWWDKALEGDQVEIDPPIYINSSANLLALIDVGEESWRMPWLTSEYIHSIRETERPNTFRRLWLNDWVSNESQFVSRKQWDACYSDQVRVLLSGDKKRVVLGADASTTRDLTALVGCWFNPETNNVEVVYARIWKPKKGTQREGKPTIDLDATVGAEIRRLAAEKQIEAIVADPYQLHNLMLAWEQAGIKVVEMPQTASRTEADQALYDAILGKRITHFGHPALTEHVLNAVARETPRGFRLDKTKTSLHIDGVVALSMSSSYTMEKHFSKRGPTKFLAITSYGIVEGSKLKGTEVSPQHAARIHKLVNEGVSHSTIRTRFSLTQEQLRSILDSRIMW